MDRKKFLKAASVITLASLEGASFMNDVFAGSLKRLPIIDTHQHLVDTRRFGANWSRPPIPGNYGVEEYQKAVKGLNLVKSVYMEVAVPTEKRREEALYAIELCNDKSNSTVGAIIRADLYDPGMKNYLSEFKNSSCIKGVRGSFNSRESVMDDQVVKNVRILGEMNMSLDFSLLPSFLAPACELVKACPETTFLVNHCGNVDPRAFLSTDAYGKADHNANEWQDAMSCLAMNKNAACKISGIATRVKGLPVNADKLGPAINQCLNIFGPDKVMFAADWPWCLPATDIRNWVQVLKAVVSERPYEEQRKLFYDNAVKFYKLQNV